MNDFHFYLFNFIFLTFKVFLGDLRSKQNMYQKFIHNLKNHYVFSFIRFRYRQLSVLVYLVSNFLYLSGLDVYQLYSYEVDYPNTFPFLLIRSSFSYPQFRYTMKNWNLYYRNYNLQPFRISSYTAKDCFRFDCI